MLGGISPNNIAAEPSLPMDEMPLAPGEVAPGIIAAVVDPLPYIPAGNPVVPGAVDVSIAPAAPAGSPLVTGSGGFSLGTLSSGRASIDLSGGYWLWLNEYRSEVMIENRGAAMETTIWGAGQVAVNGHEAGQFFGTTSFELANGAKITIETGHDIVQQEYYLDRLTVTREDRAVIITGVNDDVIGDLHLAQSNDGIRIDDHTRDGFVLVEQVASAPAPVVPAPVVPASGVEPIAAVPDIAPVLDVPVQPEAAVDFATEAVVSSVEAPAAESVAPVLAADAPAPDPQTTSAEEAAIAPVASPESPTTIAVVTIAEATIVAETAPSTPIILDAPAAPPVADTITTPEAVGAPSAEIVVTAPQPPQTPQIVGGWVSEYGDVLTTATLQQETGVGAWFGPNSQLMSLGEVGQFISVYIVFGHVTSLYAMSRMNDSTLKEQDTVDRTKNPMTQMNRIEYILATNPELLGVIDFQNKETQFQA
jgi:hypothetical protein